MRDVHSVANDIYIWTVERAVVGFDRNRAWRLFIEQHARFDARGTPRGDEILGKGQRPARIENVIDQDDVAVLNVEVEIAQDRYLT